MMALGKVTTEDRFSEELEREHEIRNLKETVAALREALERQKAETAQQVSQAVAEAQAEIRELRATVSEMRMELERRKAAGE
jgi:archaellum component FlaC